MNERTNRESMTGAEHFQAGSTRRRRLLREEQLILQVAEELVELLDREDVARSELARRLGKTKGFVSQILAGDKNLTLRTVADVCDALGFRARFSTTRDFVAQQQFIAPVHVSATAPRLNVQNVQFEQPRPKSKYSSQTEVAA